MSIKNEWTFDRWLDNTNEEWFPYPDLITIAHYLVSESKTYYFISKNV